MRTSRCTQNRLLGRKVKLGGKIEKLKKNLGGGEIKKKQRLGRKNLLKASYVGGRHEEGELSQKKKRGGKKIH